MFKWLRKPTNVEVVIFVYATIVSVGSFYQAKWSDEIFNSQREVFAQLEQKMIDGQDIIIKRTEGNDTVRYIIKPQTEKQILQYVPVIDSKDISK
jgi:hypothetical protein